MKKEPRPSKFDIALEKGDYELPSELPAPVTFIDKLIAFITFYERLGCPNNDVLYKLGKLKAHDGFVKETALELGIDPATFYKMIERLSERYEKKSHPPLPRQQAGLPRQQAGLPRRQAGLPRRQAGRPKNKKTS